MTVGPLMECVSVGAVGAAIDCTEEPNKTDNVAGKMTSLSFMVFSLFYDAAIKIK